MELVDVDDLLLDPFDIRLVVLLLDVRKQDLLLRKTSQKSRKAHEAFTKNSRGGGEGKSHIALPLQK